MPEGPECRVIAEGLCSFLRGHNITGIEFLSGRYTTHGKPAGFDAFKERLPWQCTHVGVKGKLIYLMMGDQDGMGYVWNTLGMSGSWLRKPSKHARVGLSTDDGTQLFFTDPRNFGTLRFVMGGVQHAVKLATLGLDMLNDDTTLEQTTEMLGRRRNLKRTLAEVLMDQRCFAGVGNYIKAEALWRAHLSPHRTASSLDHGDIGRLHLAVLEVIRGAYAARGMTMSDYHDINGNPGRFVRMVYGKSHDPGGRPVVREETRDGRTTHWVPAVQL